VSIEPVAHMFSFCVFNLKLNLNLANQDGQDRKFLFLVKHIVYIFIINVLDLHNKKPCIVWLYA